MITTKQKLFSVVDEAGSSLEQVRGENFTQKQAAGGAREGAGGKRPASDPTIQATVTISASQRAKLKALGGSKFIQSALDEAIISPALQAQLNNLRAKEQK